MTFESGFSTYVPTPFPLAIPILALFWADAITSSSNGGAVYYKSTTSTQLLSKASQNVGRLGNTNNFQATSLFLATWDRLSFFGASSSSDFSLVGFYILFNTLLLPTHCEIRTAKYSDGNMRSRALKRT